MKGICLSENYELEMRDFPTPVLPESSVLVKIKYAGICSTDIGYLRYGSKKLSLPVILGHEASGVVCSVGNQVKNLSIGSRVVLTNDYYVCGKCKYCRTGSINMCPERRSIGSAQNGAFAEMIEMPERAVIELPDSIDDVSAALLEPLACGIHAVVNMANAGPGDVVLIIGPGMMGAVSMLAAKASGCKTIIVGRKSDAKRLQLLKSMGADAVCDGDDEELRAVIHKISHGTGINIAVECAGRSETVQRCVDFLNVHGKYLQLSLFHDKVTFDMSPLSAKELTFIGTYAKTAEDWELAINLVMDGIIDLKPLATRIMPMNDWEEGFRLTENAEEMKVLFKIL